MDAAYSPATPSVSDWAEGPLVRVAGLSWGNLVRSVEAGALAMVTLSVVVVVPSPLSVTMESPRRRAVTVAVSSDSLFSSSSVTPQSVSLPTEFSDSLPAAAFSVTTSQPTMRWPRPTVKRASTCCKGSMEFRVAPTYRVYSR